jgi:hypothetical protein
VIIQHPSPIFADDRIYAIDNGTGREVWVLVIEAEK